MARFRFTELRSMPGSLMPRLPIELSLDNESAQVTGIIDSGSALNVLPYDVGIALGAIWERQHVLGQLSGGLAGIESRGLALNCRIPELTGTDYITLGFAWASSDSVPVLLGQTNFLTQFHVCFYRSQNYFDVWRA